MLVDNFWNLKFVFLLFPPFPSPKEKEQNIQYEISLCFHKYVTGYFKLWIEQFQFTK